MVKETTKEGKKYFQCEECLFFYKEIEWAQKCEEWCKEKKSCNIEITAHSVKVD